MAGSKACKTLFVFIRQEHGLWEWCVCGQHSGLGLNLLASRPLSGYPDVMYYPFGIGDDGFIGCVAGLGKRSFGVALDSRYRNASTDGQKFGV